MSSIEEDEQPIVALSAVVVMFRKTLFLSAAIILCQCVEDIGVARGCTGCTCNSRAEKKFGGQTYRGKL